MQRSILAATLALVFASSGSLSAQTEIAPALAGVGFLVGHWDSGVGKVADTNQTSRGSSVISVEANGAVLLRRDHTEVFDPNGKRAGEFDQFMSIYAESGTLHADYVDRDHVIHYTSAQIEPGHAVTFKTSAPPGAPNFQLTFELTDPATLHIDFEIAPPGQTTFHPIATGSLKRSS